MTHTAPTAYPRQFVPQNFDPGDLDQLNSAGRLLLERPINSPADLQRWLADASELSSVVDEFGTRKYIAKSCHTDDPAIEKAFLDFTEQIEPRVAQLFFDLQQRFLACPYQSQLTGPKYQILLQRWKADVEIFREENIPIKVQITKVVNEYDKLCAAMTATFRGEEYTLQQLTRFTEEPDRSTRQLAWEAAATRRLRDRAAIDSLFDQLIPLRQQIARNAGCADFREYTWKSYKRFDYTPEDCLNFADAIATACVPVVAALDRKRAQDLKLEKLRPWDLGVDPQNRPPLRPFGEDETHTLVAKTTAIFNRLNPQLGDDFDSLRRANNLDLSSRKGKQPGGYQSTLEESREPFIFMNAAGLQRDVETLLHEGGHAFHSLAARDEPLVFLRSAPMEFCEVASMSMELLGSEHLDLFYPNPENAKRARHTLIEGIIRILPWIATIDSFQHWLYTAADTSSAARTQQWLAMLDRFGSKLDWTGYEDARASMWHRQLHLFHCPFYYVEYGIAQLGALQLWMKYRQDPRAALANYRAALKLGGTRALPNLFSAAGIRFDFSEQTLLPLMDALLEELHP